LIDQEKYNELFLWYLNQPYFEINKQAVRLFGAEIAVFLSLLIDWRGYLENQNLLNKDNYFYLEQKHIKEKTQISLDKQAKFISLFKELGILDIKRGKKGELRRNWYYIDMFKLVEILKTERLDIYKIEHGKIKDKEVYSETRDTRVYSETRDTYPVKHGLINNNRVNNNRLKVSKETLTDSNESGQGLLNSPDNEALILEAKKIPPTSLQYNLLNFWNNLPNIPTKHIKPNTKVRLTAAGYFTQLASGRFADNKKFKPGFFNDHKLSSSTLAKQWTREEIKAGLKRLNNIFVEGYWPRNKDNLPKDLATLLYNPGKQNSWFLMVVGQEPELLDNSINFKPENHKAAKQHPDIIWPIIKQFQDKQVFDHNITAKTMDEIQSIIEYHSEMDFSNNIANYRWGNLRQLIDDFCNFIISKSYLENSIINISAEGKLFQAFIDECEDELYGRARLRPKGE